MVIPSSRRSRYTNSGSIETLNHPMEPGQDIPQSPSQDVIDHWDCSVVHVEEGDAGDDLLGDPLGQQH